MKTIDTYSYLIEISQLLKQGKEVSIPVAGNSMSPFLQDKRDWVLLEKPGIKNIKPGNIVLYQRLSGQFVLYRIQKIKKDSFYAVGDAQNEIEGPILFTRIRGVVQAVYRKGRWHSCHSIGDWLFQSAWRKLLPIRNRIFRLFRIYWRWKVKK